MKSRSRSPPARPRRSLSPPRWNPGVGRGSEVSEKKRFSDRVSFVPKSVNSPLDRGNLGFKMLKGMGWEGEGLGKGGAGIQEPVKAADTRDRSERFVGLGNVSIACTHFSHCARTSPRPLEPPRGAYRVELTVSCCGGWVQASTKDDVFENFRKQRSSARNDRAESRR
jgi:hypothetical protein